MIEEVGTNYSSHIFQAHSGQILGKDAFLKLFVAQLENQNPWEPLDNSEFITQMAQFASLEELNNLNTNFDLMLKLEYIAQAVQLIGRKVETSDPKTGEIIQGRVDKVEWKEGTPYALIGDKSVPLTSITKIW